MASGQYHVYVEGPIETDPGADMALAAAMQQRYGLPAADVLARMRKGRFRVKGNIDARTAEAYARDLATIGARVVIEESDGSRGNTGPINLHGSTPPAGVPRAATPPGGTARVAMTPSSGVPRAATPPSGTKISNDAAMAKTMLSTSASIARSTTLPIGAPRPPAQRAVTPPVGVPPTISQQIRSGLAAAYSDSTTPPPSLGALDNVGDLALSALDGSEAPPAPAPPATFSPPEPPPDVKPPVVKFAPARPTPPQMPQPSKPLDLFAPPDAAGGDALSLEVEMPQPTPVPTSPPLRTSEPSLRTSEPSLPKAPAEPPALVAAAPPRWRFAAGLVLAIVLGFVPAHVVAGLRERSADKAIDDRVAALYEQATTAEAHAGLDAALEPLRARKQAAHRNIALVALLIWAAAGGAIAYVWFRRIPWRT